MKLLILLSLVCAVSAENKHYGRTHPGHDVPWLAFKHDMRYLGELRKNFGQKIKNYWNIGIETISAASIYINEHGQDAINIGFKYNPSNAVLDASRDQNQYGEWHTRPY